MFPNLTGAIFIGISTPGIWELLLILLIILVLFGGSKIPEIARNLGKGIRELKKGLREGTDSTDTEDDVSKDEKSP